MAAEAVVAQIAWVPTKPPPAPPRFKNGFKPLVSPKNFNLPLKDVGYMLPMAGACLPAWKKVLHDCGYPAVVVVLDFETYFDDEYSMKKTSTIEYIMDPRFEVLGLSTIRTPGEESFPDYEGRVWFRPGEEETEKYLRSLQKDYGPELSGCTVVCHNGPFDVQVLARRYGIFPRFMIDTLGLARAWNSRTLNDLGNLSARLELEEKGETNEFKGLTFRDRVRKPKGRKKNQLPLPVPVITEEQVKRLGDYANNDACREFELLTILLPRLSSPATELRVMQHTLELFTRPVLEVDFAKGEDLILRMEAEVDRVVLSLPMQAENGEPLTRDDISGNNSFEWLLHRALVAVGDTVQKYMKVGKNGYILAIAKDDEERAVLEKHSDPSVRALMAARIAVKSWPLHIGRVRRIMNQARAMGGKLCVPLKYHGAHTGRYSGGEKINLQNLGSRGHELVNAVRELIVAAAGHALVIVDESQIEARVLAWIAGQWDLVEKFAKNMEVYGDFASKVLGYPVRKPKKHGGIPAVEAKMKWARNSIGKVGVLGCGYGMGTDRIFEYAQGAIDVETAEKIKVTYRDENPRIVQFWKDIERAFIYTAKYHRSCEMPRGLRFDASDDCDVVCTLPSGREIHYVRVKLEQGKYGDTASIWNDQEKVWAYTWGGSLTENVVQAMARDVLVEGMMRLEAIGHHTALSVHDELVIPTPEADAQDVLKIAITELTRRPAWGLELPLGAEGVVTKRYGGH